MMEDPREQQRSNQETLEGILEELTWTKEEPEHNSKTSYHWFTLGRRRPKNKDAHTHNPIDETGEAC